MADARVIRMDDERPRRRAGSGGAPGTAPASPAKKRAASAVAAGAARAGGERERRRRRTTPLISGHEGVDAPEVDASPADVARVVAKQTPQEQVVARRTARRRPGGTTRRTATTRAGATPKAAATKQAAPRKAAPKKAAPKKAATAAPPTRKAPTKKASTKKAPAKAAVNEEAAAPAPDATAARPPVPARAEPRAAASGAGTPRDDTLRRLGEEAEEVGRQVVASLPRDATPNEVERRVAAAMAFLRRRLTGDYHVDEFGFDAELTDVVVMNLLRPLYRHWFRVEVRGIDNIPASGGALVVANHSGTIALDALMTQVAVHDEHPQHRHLRMLGADLVFSTPVIGNLARKTGSTLAANPDAERLLSQGHLAGVWPEGFKGIGKPFSERYKLQRFGRGGFVSAALRTGTPIIPCAIVGAEEIYPILGNMRTVARVLGLPYAPITPTWPWLGPLGLVPLPTKWLIEFGTPIPTDDLGEGGADDPMLVFDLTDQVRETIQQTLYSLLVQRRSVFF